MEIIIIDLFLSRVSDASSFLSKTLAETAKILVNKEKVSLTYYNFFFRQYGNKYVESKNSKTIDLSNETIS